MTDPILLGNIAGQPGPIGPPGNSAASGRWLYVYDVTVPATGQVSVTPRDAPLNATVDIYLHHTSAAGQVWGTPAAVGDSIVVSDAQREGVLAVVTAVVEVGSGPTGYTHYTGTVGMFGVTPPNGVSAQVSRVVPSPMGPRGPMGPAGPGVVGAQGPQGDPGAAGATGPQGPKGDPGTAGATGATGIQGPPGPTGAMGATGSQGPAGPMGPNGAAGATGATGPAGVGPTGTVVMFASATPPSGWLACDGSSQLRATYAALFAVIGTAYGSVDGTHFTLPNFGSAFPRGNTVAASGGADAHTHALSAAGQALVAYNTAAGGSVAGATGVATPSYTAAWTGALQKPGVGVATTTATPLAGATNSGPNIPAFVGVAFIIKT